MEEPDNELNNFGKVLHIPKCRFTIFNLALSVSKCTLITFSSPVRAAYFQRKLICLHLYDTKLSEKTENKCKAKPAFGPYERSQTCSHVHEEIIKAWLLFVRCSSGAPLWRSLKGLLSFRVCVTLSLPLCAPPLFLSLCMCAVVLEANALKYIKG